MTGVAFNNTILGPKRLGLMRQLLSGGTSLGYLDGPIATRMVIPGAPGSSFEAETVRDGRF